MFTFTIDSSNYDETKLNLVQIEELINKHRNLIGRIKKLIMILKEDKRS